MNKHNLKCGNCKSNLKLWGDEVGCATCKTNGIEPHTGSLAAAMLTIMTQAKANGETFDARSIGADGRGYFTFSFVENPEPKNGLDAGVLNGVSGRTNGAALTT